MYKPKLSVIARLIVIYCTYSYMTRLVSHMHHRYSSTFSVNFLSNPASLDPQHRFVDMEGQYGAIPEGHLAEGALQLSSSMQDGNYRSKSMLQGRLQSLSRVFPMSQGYPQVSAVRLQ